MLRHPHALIEGVLIMSWAIRAAQAFIYIRGEYLAEYEVLVDAVAQARERGWVNRPLPGTDYTPDIVVHRGAGAYICGEETALLASLNGFRGQPTAKPPFPAVAGAYMAPTLLNNVETIATVPAILALGGDRYAEIGTEQSRGTRLFSLSGNVRRPGNYELPLTATFRDLIEGLGGGMPEGREMKCFIPGGSSTPALLPEQLDTGLAFEAVQAAGSMAGSGAVIVVDDRTCMVQFGLRVAEFYKHESCGKCTPCREGVPWITSLLAKIEGGLAEPYEIDLLLNVCDRVEGKCLCPLGDACAMPVRSYVKLFREEFEEHVRHGRCPYHDASPLSSLYPDAEVPPAAGACVSATDPNANLVTLTVDGRSLTVPKGTPLVIAAAQAGVEVPVFCYEPRLGPPIGACRMCLVEIEGMPKLQTACTMVATDGMVVSSRSDKAREGQDAVLEFICSTTRSTAPSATRAVSARCRS
jgi:NADH-quinone oxidoreductase subunit F